MSGAVPARQFKRNSSCQLGRKSKHMHMILSHWHFDRKLFVFGWRPVAFVNGMSLLRTSSILNIKRSLHPHHEDDFRDLTPQVNATTRTRFPFSSSFSAKSEDGKE
jgi:hypothetical protein